MTQRDYRIRIVDPRLPSGQIAASDLAAIADGLQTIAHRLARHLVGASGRGRSPAIVERASQVMVVGLSSGSTFLECWLGDPETLDLPQPPDDVLGQQFDAIVAGIATNTPPTNTPPLVASAAQKLARQLRARFPDGSIEFTLPTSTVSIEVPDIDSSVWQMSKDMEIQHIAVSGVLNRIDLRVNSFRITDSAGNDISLNEVAEPEDFGPLIGKLVTAEGDGEYVNGKLTGLVAPTIAAFDLPEAWLRPETHHPITGGGSFCEGVDGVTDSEIEAFLAAR